MSDVTKPERLPDRLTFLVEVSFDAPPSDDQRRLRLYGSPSLDAPVISVEDLRKVLENSVNELPRWQGEWISVGPSCGWAAVRLNLMNATGAPAKAVAAMENLQATLIALWFIAKAARNLAAVQLLCNGTVGEGDGK